MAVALLNGLISSMAHPGVDDGVGHTTAGAVRAEGVTKDVPPLEHFPLAACDDTLKMILSLVRREHVRLALFGSAAGQVCRDNDGIHATWMDLEPIRT